MKHVKRITKQEFVDILSKARDDKSVCIFIAEKVFDGVKSKDLSHATISKKMFSVLKSDEFEKFILDKHKIVTSA